MGQRAITPSALDSYRDDWHMSPGVISNDLLFLTGMTGHRSEGASTDAEEQIRDVFEKVESVLEQAGLDMSRLVEMTTYHVDIHDHIEVFRQVRDEFVTEPYPAWTAIGVSELISEDAIVEMRVIADATDAPDEEGDS